MAGAFVDFCTAGRCQSLLGAGFRAAPDKGSVGVC